MTCSCRPLSSLHQSRRQRRLREASIPSHARRYRPVAALSVQRSVKKGWCGTASKSLPVCPRSALRYATLPSVWPGGRRRQSRPPMTGPSPVESRARASCRPAPGHASVCPAAPDRRALPGLPAAGLRPTSLFDPKTPGGDLGPWPTTVSNRRNVLISGGTGSGTATLASAITAELDFANDRVFLIRGYSRTAACGASTASWRSRRGCISERRRRDSPSPNLPSPTATVGPLISVLPNSAFGMPCSVLADNCQKAR
jgi:hypothetical protein